MSDIAISVQNLSKAYRIGLEEEVPDTLLAAARSLAKAPLRNFRRLSRLDTYRSNGDAADLMWALKDVSFDVRRGEVVGVIGRNGAGKSTLLKILSRITEPTAGRVVIRGRVSSLLEVGTGFHPELTGRENVYMNGTILGMKKREIDRKFDEIVAFSGVEKFLDTPVKRYSSGMKVRLAFSVAAHLEPEILIIDEVLAVGDFEFQQKCLGKMQDVSSGGRTVLFVSHNMAAVRNLCSRVVLLHRGTTVSDGRADDVVSDYLRLNEVGGGSGPSVWDLDRPDGFQPVFEEAYFSRLDGSPVTTAAAGDDLCINLRLRVPNRLSDVRVGIGFDNVLQDRLFTVGTKYSMDSLSLEKGRCVVRCVVRELPLTPGRYFLSLGFRSREGVRDQVPHAVTLDVAASDFFRNGQLPAASEGHFLVRSSWSAGYDAVAAESSLKIPEIKA